jgi:glycosyltransferase involved in cell wall biosynthesis
MRSEADSILLLLPSLTALGGGIELYLRQFLDGLAAARPDAWLDAVLAREAGLARPELLAPELRQRLRVSGTRRQQRALRIGEFVSNAVAQALRQRPRLIVSGHVNLGPVAWGLARTLSVPLVSLTYGVEAWNVRHPLQAAALRASDRVIAISRFTADQVSRSLGIAAEKIAIVHNAVDVERFTPGPPSPRLEDKLTSLPRPRLLTVCRLDRSEGYKGIDVMLQMLAAHPELRASYLVVGDGDDRPRLEAMAATLGVRARFWGPAGDDELVELYRACDVFVMPSRKEGFGYVFIEAMAAGVPVVAGNLDGSVDALGGGRFGLLVDPIDAIAIATAVRAHLERTSPPAMRDPALLHAAMREHFGRAAYRARVADALGALRR